MHIDKYAQFVKSNWKHRKMDNCTPDALQDLYVMSLGLAGETGETLEHLKKYIRDGRPIDRDAFKKELGDVLYYWFRICQEFDFTFEEVIEANMEKLIARRAKYADR